MSRIHVDEIDIKEASNIWRYSPHGTIFTKPSVLTKLTETVCWMAAIKGKEYLCCWPVCLNHAGEPHLPNFTYFVGPFWAITASEVPIHRSLKNRREVYESFISRLEQQFGCFKCSLPLGICDVRAFDWWNYHVPEKPRINISPRYTAQICNLQSTIDVRKNYRPVRRQELRKAQGKFHVLVKKNPSIESIVDIYSELMFRQNRRILESDIKLVTALYNLVAAGEGFITTIADWHSGEIAYISLVLRGRGISNLVLSLTNSEYRGTGVSALGVHNSIQTAAGYGDTVFDFNGANSPNRGDDKHSYGAEEKLYFDLDYRLSDVA